MATSYKVLDSGLYSIPLAEVMYSIPGSGVWHQFGDVDNFTLSITPTKISRFGKNGSTRTKRAEVVTQVDSVVSFRCMQFSQFVRAVSVLGKAETMVQAAVSDGTHAAKAVKGALIKLPHFDVSNVTVGGDGDWVAGTHYTVVDAALGMVQLEDTFPEGVAENDDILFGYAAAEIKNTDGRITAEVASQTEITVELMVRNLGQNDQHQVLHLFEVTLAPNGDKAFIGEDDFAGVDIQGSALKTSKGVGILADLKAA